LTLRIDRASEGTASVLRLSGRLHAENLQELTRELAASGWDAAIDLDDVTLLDLEAVRLLESLERRGIELRNCAPYIRAWIARERDDGRSGGSPE
jgi:anti-anti-sigma regulatory factor